MEGLNMVFKRPIIYVYTQCVSYAFVHARISTKIYKIVHKQNIKYRKLLARLTHEPGQKYYCIFTPKGHVII